LQATNSIPNLKTIQIKSLVSDKMKIPELPSAKAVSTRLVRSVWKKISDKPLPDVYAYTLEDEFFFSILKQVQSNKGVIDTRIKEYGVKVDNLFIEAFTFEFKGHLIIFVKKSANLASSLEHELRHVDNWKKER
jgi:hypothetical protein